MLITTFATLQDNSVHGEDNYLTRDLGHNNLLDVVMDGVTDRGGEEASQELGDALMDASITSVDDIIEVFHEINDQLYQLGWGRMLLTTVSAALFLDGQLYVVGAGDSPVLLIRADEMQTLSGRTRGFLHAGLTRVIGAREKVEGLYRAEVTIEPGDRLLLATDGVTDNITRPELADLIRSGDSPDDAIEHINALLTARYEEGRLPAELGGRFRRDDRTAILRFFHEDTGT